jgi:hypothetical protein
VGSFESISTMASPVPSPLARTSIRNEAAARLEQIERLKTRPGACLIDPRSSKFLRRWDILVATCLIFTALVTPFEVAFLEAPTRPDGSLFLINRCIDAIFTGDMVLQFFTMLPNDAPFQVKQQTISKLTRSDQRRRRSDLDSMVTSHAQIAKKYLLGWFFIDLLSVGSLVFDVIPVLEAMNAAAAAAATIGGAERQPGFLNRFKLLKVLRVLRLIKLVRLVKSSAIVKRWQASISLDFSTQTIIHCLVMYLLAGHWFACILMLSASFADSPLQSWMGSKGYCVRASDFDADPLPLGHAWELQPPGLGSLRLAALNDVYCVSTWEKWVATYYWMIMLISGASGGDTNRGDMYWGEQLVFTCLTILSAFLWSQIIASFCDVFSNLNPEHAAFRQRMDRLNKYCRESRLDSATRRRLREYLYRSKHVQEQDSTRELVDLMSPKLQGELSLQVNGPWLINVRFLQQVEAACCVEIAMALMARVFVPTELIPPTSMYQLTHGTVVYYGRVYIGGQHWGTDCILERTDLRLQAARALAHAEVKCIDREALLGIIYSCHTTVQYVQVASSSRRRPTKTVVNQVSTYLYPNAARKAKWEAVRVGMVRLMMLESRSDKIAETRRGSTSSWDFRLLTLGMDTGTTEELQAETEARAAEASRLKRAESRKGSLLRRMATGRLSQGHKDSSSPTVSTASTACAAAMVSSSTASSPPDPKSERGMSQQPSDLLLPIPPSPPPRSSSSVTQPGPPVGPSVGGGSASHAHAPPKPGWGRARDAWVDEMRRQLALAVAGEDFATAATIKAALVDAEGTHEPTTKTAGLAPYSLLASSASAALPPLERARSFPSGGTGMRVESPAERQPRVVDTGAGQTLVYASSRATAQVYAHNACPSPSQSHSSRRRRHRGAGSSEAELSASSLNPAVTPAGTAAEDEITPGMQHTLSFVLRDPPSAG